MCFGRPEEQKGPCLRKLNDRPPLKEEDIPFCEHAENCPGFMKLRLEDERRQVALKWGKSDKEEIPEG